MLAQCASQCNAYAKALHYVEKDFRAGDLQGVNNYDYSFKINNKLKPTRSSEKPFLVRDTLFLGDLALPLAHRFMFHFSRINILLLKSFYYCSTMAPVLK